MNKKDLNPDYKKLYQFVIGKFKKTNYFSHGPLDETYYTLRVFEVSKLIIEKSKIKCNKEVVLTAAILHDVGKTKLDMSKVVSKCGIKNNAKKEWRKHPQYSVDIAKVILKKMGHSKEFIDLVCYVIVSHDKRGDRKEKGVTYSIEAIILQDADLIADVGMAGFIRPFLFSGKFKRSTVDSIKHLNESKNRIGDLKKLNLNISKSIAKKEISLQNKLAKQIFKHVHSELLPN